MTASSAGPESWAISTPPSRSSRAVRRTSRRRLGLHGADDEQQVAGLVGAGAGRLAGAFDPLVAGPAEADHGRKPVGPGDGDQVLLVGR